ncbi:MAG: type III pantothenate kinase, partial [Desulfovibrionaceae bacterium]|nr:type III pantothenate kinase [Desulfovibrionaceae bacterium]
TSDNLGLVLASLIRHAGAEGIRFAACVACSVVPAMDQLIREAAARFAGCPTFFTPADLPIPLENRYLRAEQVGADRLLAAYAARVLYPQTRSLIVIDFGTAVTFDCVQDNAYLGGLIFPGPQTALNALAGATAKLPGVSLECDTDEPAPGRDTVTSIRHGVLFGFASMVDGLTARLSAGLEGPCRIIGTGGFAATLARLSPTLQEVRKGLLLQGLEMLYREQTGRQARNTI